MITNRLLLLVRREARSSRFSIEQCRSHTTSSSGERMRVAIVGGGVAGLSTALHLAPLVTQGYLCGPIDVYDTGASSGRDIGVGIWSTALDPFLSSNNWDSHELVYQDMTQRGTFLRDVGYRTPKGHWLAESRLDGTIPDLLFLREKDMMASLRKAVHLEEQRGNISFQNGRVSSIFEESKEPWSSNLILENEDGSSFDTTARDYHLIVAADGMDSVLRKQYGGLANKRQRLTGTSALPSPLDLPDNHHKTQSEVWGATAGQEEATGSQDREYTVFRGNAPMSSKDPGLEKSFQTWGEGQSMRFATVPMAYPGSTGTKEERQVWFITINDDSISSEQDLEKRKEKLLGAFSDWHDPIGQLVRSTPADEILMERAMAHKHCMGPVENFNGVISRIRGRNPASTGNGPALVFVGDAFMTVDPILAQGFSMGMEGAANLATALQAALQAPSVVDGQLAFDPHKIRDELKRRHNRRLKRLICLLRATELVQALGQPTCGTFLGTLSKDILRPLMRFTPGAIKTPIFNYMLKYSLGLTSSAPETAKKK